MIALLKRWQRLSLVGRVAVVATVLLLSVGSVWLSQWSEQTTEARPALGALFSEYVHRGREGLPVDDLMCEAMPSGGGSELVEVTRLLEVEGWRYRLTRATVARGDSAVIAVMVEGHGLVKIDAVREGGRWQLC
ncbi:MAG: hypothetical protein RIE08_08820 [Acidimicrobiales bacterium]